MYVAYAVMVQTAGVFVKCVEKLPLYTQSDVYPCTCVVIFRNSIYSKPKNLQP